MKKSEYRDQLRDEAVKGRLSYESAPKWLKKEKDVWKIAIQKGHLKYQDAPQWLREDKTFEGWNEVIRKGFLKYHEAPKFLKNEQYKEAWCLAVECSLSYKDAPEWARKKHQVWFTDYKTENDQDYVDSFNSDNSNYREYYFDQYENGDDYHQVLCARYFRPLKKELRQAY